MWPARTLGPRAALGGAAGLARNEGLRRVHLRRIRDADLFEDRSQVLAERVARFLGLPDVDDAESTRAFAGCVGKDAPHGPVRQRLHSVLARELLDGGAVVLRGDRRTLVDKYDRHYELLGRVGRPYLARGLVASDYVRHTRDSACSSEDDGVVQPNSWHALAKEQHPLAPSRRGHVDALLLCAISGAEPSHESGKP